MAVTQTQELPAPFISGIGLEFSDFLTGQGGYSGQGSQLTPIDYSQFMGEQYVAPRHPMQRPSFPAMAYVHAAQQFRPCVRLLVCLEKMAPLPANVWSRKISATKTRKSYTCD